MLHTAPGRVFWMLAGAVLAGQAVSAAPVAGTQGSGDPVESSVAHVRPGTVRADPKTPFFVLESRLPVGNKGEEFLDVAVETPCGRPAWLFERAELVVHASRFGGAQLVSQPPSGCVACTPVVLRWYHEPTGHLALSVNVHRRLEIVPCPPGSLPGY